MKKIELKELSKQLKKVKETNIVCGSQMAEAIMDLPKFCITNERQLPFVTGTWDKFTITVDASITDKCIYDKRDNYITEINIDFEKLV